MARFAFSKLLAIPAIWPLLTIAAAQSVAQNRANTQYIFASPNKASGLTDESADRKLASFEELNAIAIADRIACSLAQTHKVGISGVLGVYDKSSENSFLVEADLEQGAAEYLTSLLGRYERQEYVLLFSPRQGGQDHLWLIKSTRSLNAVVTAVRQRHVTPVTVRKTKSLVQIWLVDIDGKTGQKPKELAAQLGGTASFEDGSAEIIGDETDRAKSDGVYRAKIKTFEQKSGAHFSSSLSNAAWLKASSRTCSAELPQ